MRTVTRKPHNQGKYYDGDAHDDELQRFSRRTVGDLKLAMALFHERLPNHLDAKLVIACHDELVVECPEEQATEVARFLEDVMVAGMNEVLNPRLTPCPPERVPVDVDIEVVKSWDG